MSKISKKIVQNLINFYPPFLGAGIKIKMPNHDFSAFDVSMKLTMFNRNYVGVHYGGSLYSMCDPFFMLIAMDKLGSDYIVWDKSAEIDFKKPGKGKVMASFRIDDEVINEVKKVVAKQGKHTFSLSVNVLDEKGLVIAAVCKTLWVGLKSNK